MCGCRKVQIIILARPVAILLWKAFKCERWRLFFFAKLLRNGREEEFGDLCRKLLDHEGQN